MKFYSALFLLAAFQFLQAPFCEGSGRRGGARKRKCRRNENPETDNCVPRAPRTSSRITSPTLTFTTSQSRTSALPTVLSTNSNGVPCPPCDRLHCQHNGKTLNCRGGTVLAVCGCCPVCAKQEGEECGGRDNYLGTCDKNLACQITYTSSKYVPTQGSTIEWRGTCQVVGNDNPTNCQPECTPEFCAANNAAICSARNSAIISRSCQGPCHHTSCKSCYYQEEPRCKKCAKVNTRCLKAYSKCVKKFRYCKNERHCKKRRKETDSFRCWIPECNST